MSANPPNLSHYLQLKRRLKNVLPWKWHINEALMVSINVMKIALL